MNLIDSHAHIYSEEYKGDWAGAVTRAQEAGVSRIYMPNIDHTTIDAMLEVEGKYPQLCIPMMGLHPSYVKKDFERELYLVEEWLGKRNFAAVGECGIDLYWDKTFLPQQQEALKVQVALAKKHRLPIVLHTREAFEETYEIIAAAQDGSLKGIFHCFSGTVEEAEKVKELGFLMGIGGVATFKNGGMDKLLPHLQLEDLVLETDCPYLAPAPHRGKRNEPLYLPLIAKRVAELMEKPVEEVAEKTTANSLQLFNP
ncbi:TatD DNase family protein [Pontibacter ummariensis]|uniref:TatD DNase family protein n=1 Tax=Pontibacter ummariensis TaxID=1610492 RepID=A0A239KPV7_9BACT|nr:TatD family hydrolase [Pontibacter ummariensis]PRY05355.1 TatD DNase family protein [Pontibacter ummariensis]SNT19762.1 TatD DNase family protein [Pontibacter ummariensis]